jgi:plastocyanin
MSRGKLVWRRDFSFNMMRKLLIATAFVALAWHPSLGFPGSADTEMADVTGQVRLVETNSHRSAPEASQVVLWLVPQQGTPEGAVLVGATKHYRMLQHNKTFEPKLLVVPLGSIVDFPNLDPWFHNVFSLYQGKRFDLGLYQARAEKEVVFDRPGPSFLFCNIHPQMTAVIFTVNSDFFGVSDKAGHILIHHVPSGRYSMHAWYESASPEFTDAPQRPIDITPGENVLPELTIPAAKHDWSHKDKYGNDYDPRASAPAY